MVGIAASTWAAMKDHCWLPIGIPIDLIVKRVQLRDLEPPTSEGLGCLIELPETSCRGSNNEAQTIVWGLLGTVTACCST